MELEIKKARLSEKLENYIFQYVVNYCEDLDVFEKEKHIIYIEKLPENKSHLLNDVLIEIHLKIDWSDSTYLIQNIDISCNNQTSIPDLEFNRIDLFDWHNFDKRVTWDENY